MNLPKKPNLISPVDVSYYWSFFSEKEKKTYDQNKWNKDVSKVNNYTTQVEKVYNKQKDEISDLESSIAKQNAIISSQKNAINTLTDEKKNELKKYRDEVKLYKGLKTTNNSLSSEKTKLKNTNLVLNTKNTELQNNLNKETILYKSEMDEYIKANKNYLDTNKNLQDTLKYINDINNDNDSTILKSQSNTLTILNRALKDQDEYKNIYNQALDKAKKINNEKNKKIHEEKLNIINNSKKLLKSKNELLNISREINLNDNEYNFRNNVANILGGVIGVGLLITLIVLCTYLISNSNQTIDKMKTIFG